MATPINTIYSWFETGDFPTQEQFHASWSSFWHKDETIPMTTIDGLSDQFGKYVLVSTFNSHLNDENAHSTYLAKRDASNLTPTNVNDWKAKLGVGDLPENIATYDYDIHNQVMMKDGTTKEATDLGKNVANSSLTSVAGAGLTLGSSWTLNANGQLYSVTNLPDKSADTSFNKMLIQNSTGQVAWGNGKTLIKNMPSLLSDTEKNTWKTQMNGGWTTNTMSVAVINPPIVDKNVTVDTWITIFGANLNLDPTNFSVELVDSLTETKVATIPNSQVQLMTGLNLSFYFNFNSLPIGNYKIKLWNGVAYYTSYAFIRVVNTLIKANLTNLIWVESVYDNLKNPTAMGVGNMVQAGRDLKNLDGSDFNENVLGQIYTTSLTTDGILMSDGSYLTMEDDFQIQYSFQYTGNVVGQIGININIPNILHDFLAGFGAYGGWGLMGSQINGQSVYLDTNGVVIVTILKIGSTITCVTNSKPGNPTHSSDSISSFITVTSNDRINLKLLRGNHTGEASPANTTPVSGTIYNIFKLN